MVTSAYPEDAALALAKARYQLDYEDSLLARTWDRLEARLQRRAVEDAGRFLRAAQRVGLVPADVTSEQGTEPEPGIVSVMAYRPRRAQAGVRVTAEDLDTGETESRIIVDDVSIVTAGTCYVHGVQDWPQACTQVWTIKGRLGRGAK